MLRINKHKITALMLAMVLVFGMSAQATLAYITAKTGNVVNTFVPVKSLNIDVTGEKVLEGRDWKEGDTFEFELREMSESGRETVASTSVGYNAEGNYSFSFGAAIREHISEAGTYDFSIIEKTGDAEGMTYSEDDYRFTVKVEADEITGGLIVTDVTEPSSPEADVKKPEIEYDEETGEYEVRVRFANQYEAPPVPVDPDPVKAYITVEKKMEYKNAGEGDKIGPAGFLFTLEEDSVADDRHQKRTDAEGNAVFELEYDKDDAGKTYIYSLKEVDEGADGVEYSDAEYDVRVAVTERDNILSAAVTCEDRAMDTFEFINVYDCGAGEDGPTDPENPEDPEDPDGPDGPGGSGESGDGSGDSGDSDGDGLGGGTGESGKDAASKTGDDSNMVLPFAAMLTSAAIIALLAVECRRRKV